MYRDVRFKFSHGHAKQERIANKSLTTRVPQYIILKSIGLPESNFSKQTSLKKKYSKIDVLVL